MEDKGPILLYDHQMETDEKIRMILDKIEEIAPAQES